MTKSLYNKFTSKLRIPARSRGEIPCYKKLSYFYYYDVLEACARVLFQNDLEVTKAQAEEEGEAGPLSPSSKDYSR